ncbi:MAG: lactonase family protein [Terrimicrobiaceae bacterium]
MTMLHARETPFYVGTYSAPGKQVGILRCSLDLETGKLAGPVVVADVNSPSFLAAAPDGRSLYAAIEQGDGEVAAFRILQDLSLAPLNSKPSGGKGTCHVWADKAHVLASNYTGGNAVCFPVLPDGSLGDATANIAFTGSGPDPARQKQSYAHAATLSPDGRFAYVCDLGSDQVWIFRFEGGPGKMAAADPPSGKVPPGSGPRHIVPGTRGRFLYVNNEMGLSVSVFERNGETGALRLLQTIPTLPEGDFVEGATTSGIALHPSGRWLYVSNRRHDSVTVFEVQPGGHLRFVRNTPSTVEIPREFNIDPTGAWLVIGGQKDGAIVSMKIDGSDGTLTPTDRLVTGSVPVSFSFLPGATGGGG